MSSAPPTGEVTFLFTDIEGSTKLWEQDADKMAPALAEHDRRLRTAIEERNGYVFTTAGDSFAVAFSSPTDALGAAVAAQLSLRAPCDELDLRVRMGLHTGTATHRDADYFGATVNRCARLLSAGHGGQILVSGTTERLLRSLSVDDIELVDCGEHRLKDLLRPERIFQVRHPDMSSRFPALRTLSGPGIDLPIQLTSFVGRTTELGEVRSLLSDTSHRLITLTGSGGAGKTRLAYQVAAEAVEEFPDGIRAVELARTSSPELVHDEIAAAIGAHAVPATPLIETITGHIGTQKMLLVLDNSEHLVDSVAETAHTLLTSCPNLKLLATSRERIGCAGEIAYRVPSLMLPSVRDRRADVESHVIAVGDCDAVRLFSDRAVLAQPDFRVDAHNVDALVSICRRLDGIPLALELAAARVGVLSPAQIAERLDERFRLLGGATRGALERHRTLVATIDWSYDHLSDQEQVVFRRSSVFSGSFDLAAAEAVCTGDDVDVVDLIDLISGLVDKSMLVPDEDAAAMRYRLLESMRLYGVDRLVESDSREAVAVAHATYYAGLGEHLQQLQRAGDLQIAIARLALELDNVRGALRFSLDNGQLALVARTIGSVGHLWYSIGLFREGIDWCRELFDAGPELPDELLASALHAYATLLGSWARPAEGVDLLRREIELRRHIGDPARLAAALNNLGSLQCDLGQFEAGERTLREATVEFRRAGATAVLSLASLAHAFKDLARYREAAELFAEALDEAVADGDDYGIALARTGLGECAVHDGRPGEARRDVTEGRAGYDTLGVQPGVAYGDFLLALVDLGEGATGDARRRLTQALSQPDAHWYEATKFWIMQMAGRAISQRDIAAQLLGAASRHYDGMSQPQPAWVQRDYETSREQLSHQLGEHEFAAAFAEGHRMLPQDAITLTLDALQQPLDQSNA